MTALSFYVEDIAVLKRCPFLHGNSEELIRCILHSQGASLLRFSAGDIIYSPHTFRRCLGIVLSGQLQVTKGGLSVSILEPGEVFGAAALYSDAPSFATTITAKRDSRCLLLPQKLVDDLIAKDAAFRERYLRYLTGRIHFLSSRLDFLAQQGSEGKLERYLLSNADENLTVTSSATDLARRLGLSRASLYRAFEVLEEGGLIARTGKAITIPDPAALRAVCDHTL